MQVLFHLDDMRCAERAAANPFFVSVPGSLTLARAIYGNRYISRPGYIPPRGVLVDAGVGEIGEDFIELDDIGFLYNPVQGGAFKISTVNPRALLCCENRPPKPFTIDDFETAWSEGGSSHQADLANALIGMLTAWAFELPLDKKKWTYLSRCDVCSAGWFLNISAMCVRIIVSTRRYVFPLEIWSQDQLLERLKDVARTKSASITMRADEVIQLASSESKWNDLVNLKSFGQVEQPLSDDLTALVDHWKADPTSISE